MSYLRQIMQRVSARSNAATERDTPADPHLLAEHLRLYQQQLERCTAAMLQYECAWLEQHIETLELCGFQPEMQATAGGAAHVNALLGESRQFQQLLEQRMAALGLEASRHRARVVPSEHAWELADVSIRREWGIGEAGDSGPGQG